MLVKDRMSHPVITVTPDTPMLEALAIMRRENIRRLPVVNDKGELVGIVTEKDVMTASPSPATSLTIWELNYLVSKIKVAEIMTKEVLTVDEDTPIEEAARLMAQYKIGGLPVMRNGHLVGIITEGDLFKTFLEIMGAYVPGVRITVCVPNVPGQLARVAQPIAERNGNIISVATFEGEAVDEKCMVLKVRGIDAQTLREVIEKNVPEARISDVRDVHFAEESA